MPKLMILFMFGLVACTTAGSSFKVDFIPVIVDSGPSIVTFFPGDKMVLSCVVKAYPTPVAKIVKLSEDSNDTGDEDQWRLLDQELDFYSNVVGDSVIEVTLTQTVTASDSGWYRCKTENINGHTHADTFVEVVQPPGKLSSPLNTGYKEWLVPDQGPTEEEWITEWFTKWVTVTTETPTEWATDEWPTVTDEWVTDEWVTDEWVKEDWTEDWITDGGMVTDEYATEELPTLNWEEYREELDREFYREMFDVDRYHDSKKKKSYQRGGWMWKK